jgi:glycosyltransferase involved in cell wall biosynthesis
MPNYNHAKYLRTSLDGLCIQTRPADEIIVVDDGSTDDSLLIINEYADRYPNLKVICNGSNRGIFYSIERALEVCASQYIAILSADDKILPGFVEKSMRVLEKYWWTGLCFSAYAVMDGETEEIHDFSHDPSSNGAFELQRYTEYMTPMEFRKQLRGGNIWMSSNTVVLRKEVFLEAGGLNERLRWHTDWFINAVSALRYGACVVPEVLSAIRTRTADSHSGKAYEKTSEQRQVIRNIIRELYRPKFWDIWFTFLRHPVLFSPLDREVLPVLVETPLGWPFAAGYAKYCKQAGIPMRLEGRAAKFERRVNQTFSKSTERCLTRNKSPVAKPTVSVLMANYNHARYLDESLTAFCSQTRLPNEFIIIDDGSTDNSLEVIEKYARQYPFIRVLRNDRNRGQMYSVNRALSEAKGDYINWAAADDHVAPDFLEKSLSAIERHPGVGVCQAEYALFYENNGAFVPQRNVANVFNFGRMPEYLSPWRYREWLKDEIVWLSTNGALVRRNVLLEMGAYHAEMEWHADWFSVQAAALRYGLCVVPEPLAALRVQTSSYSADGMHDYTRHSRVINAMFEKLNQPEFQDIRRDFCKFPVIISALGPFIYEHMKRTPRLWHYLFRHYLWAIAATLAIKRPLHTCMVALHRKANRIRGIPHKIWHVISLYLKQILNTFVLSIRRLLQFLMPAFFQKGRRIREIMLRAWHAISIYLKQVPRLPIVMAIKARAAARIIFRPVSSLLQPVRPMYRRMMHGVEDHLPQKLRPAFRWVRRQVAHVLSR